MNNKYVPAPVNQETKSQAAEELANAWILHYAMDQDKHQHVYSLLVDLMDNTPPEIVAELLAALEVGT